MNKQYEKDFVNAVIKLEAIVELSGEMIKLSENIVKTKEPESIQSILIKLDEIIGNVTNSKESKLLAKHVYDCLFMYIGSQRVQELTSKIDKDDMREHLSLNELIDSLDGLVGLNNVKKQVKDLIAFQIVNQKRISMGIVSAKRTMHLAFTGNPGTGKTTVARIIGQIYSELGILSKGHFIEVSRTDLIAGYQGQTALKVKKIIDEAKGGVLFIDEAYSITENDHTDSYGRECLTELTKALEDYREDLVVIVAGYTLPMQNFFESNPGLKSRFNTFIEFDDYSAEQLLNIVEKICTENEYVLSDELKETITIYFQDKINENSENFANGRLARNLFEKMIVNHARRCMEIENLTKDELMELRLEDFKKV